MEFRSAEESKDPSNRNEETKNETDKPYFICGHESEESEIQNVQNHVKEGGGPATRPSDVRNGDLVSLLLAATPPYLYNIPLVPQTFFFSEMLKSFVQAKTERQNLKMQQSQGRRQRKRGWREVTPPKSMQYEGKDKPLELTTPKQSGEKQKIMPEKLSGKKHQADVGEKKCQNSKFSSNNFSVEKLANSSITSGSEMINGNTIGELIPPTPPPWYPLLYPPHPPYGIDPLHFFIDLRVSAHFWNSRKLATDKINNETSLTSPPFYLPENKSPKNLESPFGKAGHRSAFSVPTMRNDAQFLKGGTKKKSQNVHYVISSLKDIYKALEKRDDDKEIKEEKSKGEDEEKKCKDLRALIGLELVVDYFKQENDGEDDNKSSLSNPDQKSEFQTVSVE